MLLVIEGPDCSGKSTLARLVMEAHRASGATVGMILKKTAPDPPDRNPFTEYERELQLAIPDDPSALVVCDRWALGELIYGPLFRGASRLSAGGALHVEMALEALGAMKILLQPETETILGELKTRGDDFLTSQKEWVDDGEMVGICLEYAKLGREYGYARIEHRLVEADVKLLVRGMFKPALSAQMTAKTAPGYLGSLVPSVILAGDVRGNAEDPDPPFISAFTPAAHGSASYLMGALAPYASRVVREFGILNTGEPGMDLSYTHAAFGHPQWVALGGNAATRLTRAAIPHTRVPHPQWWRRFRYHRQEEYGRVIMDAAKPWVKTSQGT